MMIMMAQGDSGGPLIRYVAVTEDDGSPGHRAHLVGQMRDSLSAKND